MVICKNFCHCPVISTLFIVSYEGTLIYIGVETFLFYYSSLLLLSLPKVIFVSVFLFGEITCNFLSRSGSASPCS